MSGTEREGRTLRSVKRTDLCLGVPVVDTTTPEGRGVHDTVREMHLVFHPKKGDFVYRSRILFFVLGLNLEYYPLRR